MVRGKSYLVQISARRLLNVERDLQAGTEFASSGE